jgi:dihydroflavonol-4-reductase
VRVLVTGATGFLGEHLVESLVQAGGVKVRALVRKPTTRLRELGVEMVTGDMDDPETLRAAVDGCEGIYHLAGLVSRRPDEGQKMMRLHVDGTRHLLESAAAAGVRRMVLASSSGTVAVSEEPEPIPDETWPYATRLVGRWPYYLSKIYQEKLAFEYSQGRGQGHSHGHGHGHGHDQGREMKAGIEVVAVNPSLLLGPGDYRMSSTGDVARFLRREIPVVPSGGVNFVDVRDAARATVVAMHDGRAGERYFLGGPNWTFAEFFGRLERSAKVRGPWLRMPRQVSRAGAVLLEELYKKAGRGEPPVDRVSVEMGEVYWYCDSSKAERELGFTIRDPAETLDDTIRFLRRLPGQG